jgi:HD-like signal output (HDOD) protein
MDDTTPMTTETTQILLDKIRELPPLPLVARKLVETMQGDACTTDEVTQIMSCDQALAAQVLKLANSSFFGLSGQVGTVSRAVVLLGFSAVRSLAISLGVANALRGIAHRRDVTPFWQHSIACAAGARLLALDAGRSDPEEAFVGGLLHDVGALILDLVSAPGTYDRVVQSADDILAAEEAAFGIHHAKAGQTLLRHWRLPEALCHGVRFHHHPDAYQSDATGLTALVAGGDHLAAGVGRSHEHLANDGRFFAIAAHLGVSLRTSGALLSRLEQAVADTVVFLSVTDIPPVSVRDDGAPLRVVAIVGGDAERTGWIQGLVGHAGYGSVSLPEFLAQSAEATPVDLVIVDGPSISPQQIHRLQPVLSATPAALACFGPAPPGLEAALGRRLPVLPVAFVTANLDVICSNLLAP